MKTKQIISIVKKVLTWIITIFAIFMMLFTVISATTFNKTDRKVFGYQILTVLSDSMKATDFEAGDLIFIKEVDPKTLEEGDIISYQSLNNDNFGEIVTHKIRTLTTDATGAPGFITYGTTTGVDDEKVVVYSQVIGKYQGKIPKVGYFFTFLKTTPGYIVCILLPFLFLIIVQGVNGVIILRRYRQEQIATMDAEHERQKQELEDERKRLEMQQEESRKMLEELTKLKEQLSAEQTSKQSSNQDSNHPQEEDESKKWNRKMKQARRTKTKDEDTSCLKRNEWNRQGGYGF